jgi:cyclophilin family peptidyl-prolyl cis-trans isomerase
MQKIFWILLLCAGTHTAVVSQTLSKETVLIESPYGNMKIKLYEETPLHKQNFLKLVKEGFYDSLLFHRVINQFMIQGGDPLSRRAKPGDSLGHGDNGYMIPAEFNEKLLHKKGVIAAARENDDINPHQASSGCQFYIVMGKVRSSEDMKKYEARITKARRANAPRLGIEDSIPDFKFTKKQWEYYTSTPGTPHLDGSYTVFGEVVEGIEVIDKIAAVKTDKRDRPLEDVRMKIKVQK